MAMRFPKEPNTTELVYQIVEGKVTAASGSAGIVAGRLESEDVNLANTTSLLSNLHSAVGGLIRLAGPRLPGGDALAVTSSLAQIKQDIKAGIQEGIAGMLSKPRLLPVRARL